MRWRFGIVDSAAIRAADRLAIFLPGDDNSWTKRDFDVDQQQCHRG
jgi:hypothetical protein